MHRIFKINISNFKSIKEIELPLESFTPLVGYNNAGKTNILQALSWVVKKYSLQASDFCRPESPVVVTAEISGIDENVLGALGANHRNRIEPYVLGGVISLRRKQDAPDLPVAQISLQIKRIENEEEIWDANPAGIDQAISQLFPEPIFIGAMENAAEDVGKFASGTTIGKLIKEIVGPVSQRNSDSVRDSLAQVAKRLSADGDEKDESLVNLDNQIHAELERFFPGVIAKTHIQTPEFSDFLKSATIKIYDQQNDGAIGRDASAFGHGAQRSVQIALIKCLSKIRRQAAENQARTTLLLIDEPELYLHPQAIEVVRVALSRLSAEGYQVVFTTHSANMIARSIAPNALLIRRTPEQGTICFPRMVDAVQNAIADADHQSATLFALSNSTRLLFAEKVVLAEGKTEQTLLPDLFQSEAECSLEEDRLGLVSLGSSSDVPKALPVLSAMGIPTKAVVDLDFAFRPAIQHELIANDNVAVLGCRAILARLQGEGKIDLAEDGFPKKHGEVTAARAYEIMAAEPDAREHVAAVHEYLKQLGIWVWTDGTIETHLGLEGKTPSVHSTFLSKFLSDGFREALPNYASVQQMLQWLRQ
ncbi:ATP-dependent nuclease [Paracoccus zhejiangensis]|uniref:OLD family endonuclease n=1 Tax=Paracoccus zhejiangensis TaxID=1077935 RepID=A0A2H5EUV8_9RHOB|nr:AAA family ATPase [Paracoccus zhejiangensis]AUH63070.1 OLD family endonuclease [Paracoccus zhejiangensis]